MSTPVTIALAIPFIVSGLVFLMLTGLYLYGRLMAKIKRRDESPRVYRRLHFFKRWSREQAIQMSSEIREQAVRMLLDQQGEYDSQLCAINSIADKVGCRAETLRNWVRQSEQDLGIRNGVTSNECARLKEPDWEDRELKRAN